MRLGTLRIDGGTVAVRVEGEEVIVIDGYADLGALLANPDWRAVAAADGDRLVVDDDHRWAQPVLRPGKIVCVGLNYRNHILEMGRELPEHPTLFAKYPEALVGPYDTITIPEYAAQALDWEGELAVIVGRVARRLNESDALEAIAGYAVINDVTMRDFQYRTPEWFQGKTFEATSPFGPQLVTADEFGLGPELSTRVNDETVQRSSTGDLVFSPAALVSYVSKIVTLQPGDVIATGTPGGVGHARKPPRYLADGDRLITGIEGLGELRNTIMIGD